MGIQVCTVYRKTLNILVQPYTPEQPPLCLESEGNGNQQASAKLRNTHLLLLRLGGYSSTCFKSTRNVSEGVSEPPWAG